MDNQNASSNLVDIVQFVQSNHEREVSIVTNSKKKKKTDQHSENIIYNVSIFFFFLFSFLLRYDESLILSILMRFLLQNGWNLKIQSLRLCITRFCINHHRG